MRVGIHNVRFDFPGAPQSIAPTLVATARAAEDAGVAGFTLMDHWFQMEQMAPADDPMLEGYTSLGFVAGHTETLTTRFAGDGGDLPASRSVGQDRRHPRCPVGRPGAARHRRRVVRA